MTSNRKLPDSSPELSGEFAESIRSFRTAMHYVGQCETAPDTVSMWLAPARKRRQAAQRRMILTMAAGVALLFGGVLPLTMHNSRHETPTAQVRVPVQTVDNTTSDTALLEQVDSAVTESVPDSLAPLAELDNWSSESKTENRQ